MSTIANELAGIKTQLDLVNTALATLGAGITALKNQISQSGDTLSPASQAILDQLSTEAANLATSAAADVAELPPSNPPAS